MEAIARENDVPESPWRLASLLALLDLSRRARSAGSVSELAFLLVNDSHAIAPYRQAALWLASEGVHTLSGVVRLEANAPYVHWLEQVSRQLAAAADAMQDAVVARAFSAMDLPAPLMQQWQDWWPAHALWLSLPGQTQAGLLLVRDAPWTDEEMAVLGEWADTWRHAFQAKYHPRLRSWPALRARLRTHVALQPQRRWWQQSPVRWSLALLAILVFPVRLTVLPPGELVPAHPFVVRAPLDGVLDAFDVQPNQFVKKGQPLFGFDQALIHSRLDVAVQALATAETEYRQISQQALNDAKYKPQLALVTGKIEERRAEVDFLNEQLTRARVLAPQDGVVLFDDPGEWIGRPVAVGERIMRIAAPSDVEVEAWLPLADAIVLAPGAPVSLYLNASPLSPVSARLRYLAHDAVQRPDGSHAYRVRATLDAPTGHRVGLKGTAKLYGGWVPLGYWMLRRPLAGLRAALGY